MLATDQAYIIASWLKSYRQAEECWRISTEVYFAMYRPVVETLLEREVVDVAWEADLPDAILGWRCRSADSTLLHYAHVRRDRWRRCGIGTWMLRDMQDGEGAYSFAWPKRSMVGKAWRYEPWRRLLDGATHE